MADVGTSTITTRIKKLLRSPSLKLRRSKHHGAGKNITDKVSVSGFEPNQCNTQVAAVQCIATVALNATWY